MFPTEDPCPSNGIIKCSASVNRLNLSLSESLKLFLLPQLLLLMLLVLLLPLIFLWWTPPVIITIRFNGHYTRVLLHSCYTTITEWGVHLKYSKSHINAPIISTAITKGFVGLRLNLSPKNGKDHIHSGHSGSHEHLRQRD